MSAKPEASPASEVDPLVDDKQKTLIAIPNFAKNINKLDAQGSNFSQWFLDIQVHSELLLQWSNVLNSTEISPFENQVLKYLIYSSVDDAFGADVNKAPTASHALRALYSSYDKSNRTSHIKVFRELMSLEYPSDGASLRSHAAKFNALVRELDIVNYQFTRDNLFGTLFQLTLKPGGAFENLNRALNAKTQDGAVSFDMVVSTATSEENNYDMNKTLVSSLLVNAGNTGRQYQNKGLISATAIKCHLCNCFGHSRRACPTFKVVSRLSSGISSSSTKSDHGSFQGGLSHSGNRPAASRAMYMQKQFSARPTRADVMAMEDLVAFPVDLMDDPCPKFDQASGGSSLSSILWDGEPVLDLAATKSV